MTKADALDILAIMVAIRVMGPDARRKLHVEALRDDRSARADRFRRLQALLDGHMPAVTLQDRLDLRAMIEARSQAVFPDHFWRLRHTDLCNAGFNEREADEVIARTRRSITNPHVAGEPIHA